MTFFVYENWTINKARVHRSTCAFCNAGEGLHRDDSGKNGKWHGPFDTSQDAFALANKLNRLDVRGCGSCAP